MKSYHDTYQYLLSGLKKGNLPSQKVKREESQIKKAFSSDRSTKILRQWEIVMGQPKVQRSTHCKHNCELDKPKPISHPSTSQGGHPVSKMNRINILLFSTNSNCYISRRRELSISKIDHFKAHHKEPDFLSSFLVHLIITGMAKFLYKFKKYLI